MAAFHFGFFIFGEGESAGKGGGGGLIWVVQEGKRHAWHA